MDNNDGRSGVAVGLSSDDGAASVSALRASIPNADAWFCDRGDFWGTINQLCLCAKCGKNEIKRHDEPRHYAHMFKPTLHMLCDACYDGLPDGEEITQKRAISAGLRPETAVEEITPDGDMLTGCADDQLWASVCVTALRRAADNIGQCQRTVEALIDRLRDSDGSGEADETRSGSAEGDSADPKGIAQ